MSVEMKLDYSDVSFRGDGKLKLLIVVGTRPEIIRPFLLIFLFFFFLFC